jgi:DNA-directed RNA polymerase specialized sigma24 family protein
MQYPQRLNQTPAALENHEQLFAARYQHLLAWALHLAGRDRAEAEDLLHDAYIQFTLTRPELNTIRNLDGYLFGVLRVLWLSRQRRAGRARLEQLSAIEYDSAEMGLWLSDPRELNRVQDELRAICRYACARKESSKAGSVLILRFFHGYYPSEIARVLQATRKAVDSRLALARQEARLYLDAPERLGFINSNTKATRKAQTQGGVMAQEVANKSARVEDSLMRELRAEIFQSRQGDCFTRAELQRLYGGGEADAVEADQLGHLVSCPRCLDLVNEILGLPPLAERHPNDTIGNDPGDSGDSGNGSSAGTVAGGKMVGTLASTSTSELERRACWRARQVFEHQPRELHIAVNGRLVASQKVHAEVNEQTLELRQEDLAESPAFIEIFSELGLRMLLLYVDTARTAPKVQAVDAELSDGRSLAMTLQFQEPASLLTVVYHDPLAQTVIDEPEPSLWARATAWLREAWATASVPPPALIASLGVVLCVAGLLAYLRWPATRAVTAAELLQKSIAAEARFAGEQDKVAHRTFNIETRNAATAEVVARRRVELWQSADRGLAARRLYDEQNRLVAGEWLRPDGSSELLFRRERSTDKAQMLAASQAAELDPTIWRGALDVQKFSALAGAANITIEETANAYVLSREWPHERTAASPGQLLKATLTLNRPSLRAVAQTLFVSVTDGVREYHLSEASFEQLPLNSVLPEIFQPDPELLAAGVRRIESLSPASAAITAGGAAVQPNAINLSALEVEARYLLDQANANLGEQVSLTRTGAGLKIRALVETEQRKAELLAALSSLRAQAGVALEIETYEEAARRQPSNSSAPTLVTDAVVTQKPIPVAAELRSYFASQATQASENRIEEQVARFAGRMQEQAPRSLRHAWALKSLASQLSPEELAALPPEARTKWRQMVRTHALAIKRETESLRAALQPIFYPGASATALPEEAELFDLKQLAAQLASLASEHDTVIGKAFSKSANEAAGAELKSQRFWQSLRRAEQLADAVLKTRELAQEN